MLARPTALNRPGPTLFVDIICCLNGPVAARAPDVVHAATTPEGFTGAFCFSDEAGLETGCCELNLHFSFGSAAARHHNNLLAATGHFISRCL